MHHGILVWLASVDLQIMGGGYVFSVVNINDIDVTLNLFTRLANRVVQRTN